MARAVDVGLERDAFFPHASVMGKTEHLKTAAVSQDRPVPPHKGMEPSCGLKDVNSGPEHQVIGVAQNDLSARLNDFTRMQ